MLKKFHFFIIIINLTQKADRFEVDVGINDFNLIIFERINSLSFN